MANYYGVGRTNYFRVKDLDAFIEELKPIRGLNLQVREDLRVKDDPCPETGKPWVMLMDDNPDGGGWCPYYDQDGDEADYDVDLEEVIANHLIDGDVAIIMETGHEKYRYLIGWASAVNSKGESVRINLDDIYKAAETLGSIITRAQY